MSKYEVKIELENIDDDKFDEFDQRLEDLVNEMDLKWLIETRKVLSGTERREVVDAIQKAFKEGKVHIEDGALD